MLLNVKSAGSLVTMLHAGKLEVRPHGQRLRGGFTLVRMKDRQRQWRLIKQRDEQARPGIEVVQQYQTSVLSGRTIGDVQEAVSAGMLKTYRCG